MDAIDNGDALNLSTGLFTSFKEFAGIAARLCGYSPVVEGTSNTPEGVFARGGDTRKQGAFGFKPTISLEEGVQRGLNYFLSAPAAK